ncbi:MULTISPECIES: tRNA threonylcarbamoyladenosine dehydratase [Dyella]|uniref:tRNA threonylcarbamoyladenosine dehydratase n=2 Tax=Dyella TaxID=231454 RepID=A0A4R0Z2M0_9GAMM|nr:MULTISPECIES: tRNA threonylcarbamoyladenosine dehydratase [Dyella]TBR38972.1 tRNA threonylcarbamoyladenosine dehydratase [Dyella terrae]TCI13436.1 tRNA threonylcarbamoyladenosine dehydratase [Dyella soli]
MSEQVFPKERFQGVERLYGTGSVDTLSGKHVCVIGVGGVGSWAAEALARSGVGRITLIDADDICVSNTNRQLHALDGQFGKTKVAVMAERLQAINPALQIDAIERFLTTSTLDELLDRGYDVVLDACDAFRVKLEAIAWCRRRKLPMVSVGSAGGRTDPTQIRVRDLSRTEHDAMFSLIRKKLRQDFNFPRNPDRYFGISAVYSLQNVQYPQPDGTVCGTRPPGGDALNLACGGGLGAATHVTGAFAFAAVGKVLEKLFDKAGA